MKAAVPSSEAIVVRKRRCAVYTRKSTEEGLDQEFNSLDAQRSYYLAQITLVQIRLTAAENLIDLYEALGGDSFLQSTPVCQALPSESSASSANVASQCSPI